VPDDLTQVFELLRKSIMSISEAEIWAATAQL
jgi:hypothetical protein